MELTDREEEDVGRPGESLRSSRHVALGGSADRGDEGVELVGEEGLRVKATGERR